jgi:hypothetical protein
MPLDLDSQLISFNYEAILAKEAAAVERGLAKGFASLYGSPLRWGIALCGLERWSDASDHIHRLRSLHPKQVSRVFLAWQGVSHWYQNQREIACRCWRQRSGGGLHFGMDLLWLSRFAQAHDQSLVESNWLTADIKKNITYWTSAQVKNFATEISRFLVQEISEEELLATSYPVHLKTVNSDATFRTLEAFYRGVGALREGKRDRYLELMRTVVRIADVKEVLVERFIADFELRFIAGDSSHIDEVKSYGQSRANLKSTESQEGGRQTRKKRSTRRKSSK